MFHGQLIYAKDTRFDNYCRYDACEAMIAKDEEHLAFCQYSKRNRHEYLARFHLNCLWTSLEETKALYDTLFEEGIPKYIKRVREKQEPVKESRI